MKLRIVILISIALIAANSAFTKEPPIPPINEIPGWSIVYGNYQTPDDARLGEVVSLIPSRKRLTLKRSDVPYDPMVVGVAVLDTLDSLRVAVGGEVEVLVDPSVDEISAGEWLVTSGATGKIMAIRGDYPLNPIVVGLALENYEPSSDKDRIRVLLTPGEQIAIPPAKSGE